MLTVRFFTCLLTVSALLAACNFYKVSTVPRQDTRTTGAKLDSLQGTKRYLILRNGDDAFRIAGLQLNSDGQTAVLQLDSLGADHRLHLVGGIGAKMRYRKSVPAQSKVVKEVHVYTPFDSTAKPGPYTLNLANIRKIDVLDHDAKRSTNSHVLAGLGIVLGGLAIAAVIVIISIPFD